MNTRSLIRSACLSVAIVGGIAAVGCSQYDQYGHSGGNGLRNDGTGNTEAIPLTARNHEDVGLAASGERGSVVTPGRGQMTTPPTGGNPPVTDIQGGPASDQVGQGGAAIPARTVPSNGNGGGTVGAGTVTGDGSGDRKSVV